MCGMGVVEDFWELHQHWRKHLSFVGGFQADSSSHSTCCCASTLLPPHLSVIKLHHRLHREMCHRGCCSDTVGAQSREPARFRKREHCVHTRKTERLPVSVGSSGPERPALPVRRPPWGQAEGLGPYPGESGRSRAALAVGGPSWACVAE